MKRELRRSEGEGRAYGARRAFEDADLAVALFENVVDGAHEFELHVVGLVGVVEVDFGRGVVWGGHFECVCFVVILWWIYWRCINMLWCNSW